MENKCPYGQLDCDENTGKGVCMCAFPHPVDTLRRELKTYKKGIDMIKKWVQIGSLEDRVARVLQIVAVLEGDEDGGKDRDQN